VIVRLPLGGWCEFFYPLALADLLAGQVQVMFDVLPESIGHIRAGARWRCTALRSEALPDVPIMSDFVPGFETSTWFGIGAPRNTPAAIIERLSTEINAALYAPTAKSSKAVPPLGYLPCPRQGDPSWHR